MLIESAMKWLLRTTARVRSNPRKGAAVAACLLALLWLCTRDAEQPQSRDAAEEIPPVVEAGNLDRRLAVARNRSMTQDRIAQQVLAGHLSLRAAAERYRDLNATNPKWDRQAFEAEFPGSTAEERCCRQVFARVAAGLWRQPERARSVRQQLERVLEEDRQQGSLARAP
jgi:hypothetical protein